MGLNKDIVIASNNEGKIREFKDLFKPLRVLSQKEVCSIEVEETGTTFIENALLKAKAVSEETNALVIADDSGLVVPELNYEPGLRSSRYAFDGASDQDNKDKLKSKISDLGLSSLSAYFICVLVAVRSNEDPLPIIAEGKTLGRVKLKSSGKNGFGYDDMFYPHDSKLSFADMEAIEKLDYSHRGQALQKLIKKLRENGLLR